MEICDSQVFVVVTGPDGSPRRMETKDGIFMLPPLFTPPNPSHSKQRSAFPCPCCLCFSSFLFSGCLFSFLLFLILAQLFGSGNFVLLRSRKLDDLKANNCLMSCPRLPEDKKRRVNSSLFPGLE